MLLATAFQINSATPGIDQIMGSPAALLIFKVFLILLMIIYVIFSIVVVRQIAIMKQTVVTTFSPTIQIMGYLHLIFAVSVLLLFFLIL